MKQRQCQRRWNNRHRHAEDPSRPEPKSDLDAHLIPSPKLKSIVDLSVECKTAKLLEDNIGEDLDDLEYGDAFFHIAPKT